MAPTLEADAEALAWTQSAPRRELWAAVTAPTVVLLGTGTFPFMADAAGSIVASLASAEQAELPGSGHRWRAGDLADRIGGYLPAEVRRGPGATRSS